MDEHGAVADAVVAEQPAEDRVVPGFRQFIVEARVDQLDVGTLDLRPGLDLEQVGMIEAGQQTAPGFPHLLLVETDPRCGGALGFLPLRLLEARPRAFGDQTEMLSIIVEAEENLPRDFRGQLVLHHDAPTAGHEGSPSLAARCLKVGFGLPVAQRATTLAAS